MKNIEIVNEEEEPISLQDMIFWCWGYDEWLVYEAQLSSSHVDRFERYLKRYEEELTKARNDMARLEMKILIKSVGG